VTRKRDEPVRLTRIYTRGGDAGETSLGDGSRTRKDAPRIAAIGAVDEANAAIGVLRGTIVETPAVASMLSGIQNDLFDVGADLCVPGDDGTRLRLTETPVLRLEAEVEAMNAALPPLTSFILPGGTPGAAQAHMVRVIVRRAERAIVALESANPAVLRYLNRLSDHMFVLARVLNHNGTADVLWVPGANR
jgi:cob(I)alamin adenosyltransferase